MKYFSLSLVVTLIIIGYVINTIWSLIEIFIPPKCNPNDKCFQSYLGGKPVQNLLLFSSVLRHPSNQHANKIHAIRNFNYSSSSSFEVKLDLPRKTRNNGTLFLHVALVDNNYLYSDFQELQRSQSVETIPMVIFTEPRAATFNLLNNQDDEDDKIKLKNTIKTTAHINRDVTFSIFTDDIKLPANKIPGELYPYMRFTNGKYQPIIQHNILKTRLKDLEEIRKDTTEIVVSVHYAPVSFGLLRLTLHMKIAIQSLQKLGFSEKDADDVKGIFADTNLYLLSATIFIASFHLLFDFLAFKNDVSFWRGKKSMAGLSIRTVLWRAFSQSVILLYLFDEKTSMIVLIPAVIGALIELWKAKKVLRVGIEWSRVNSLPRLVFHGDKNNSAEQRTRAVDAEAMRYLCYLLYPLCIAGAVYSLLYEPHKSWYSWSLHSLVNGVYAFGFLFMLPQLFVNYKLKSVAALPWRAFMYKAFNTFIDDIFAFIITMPTAHRVACFRDDIVFLIYLYQRWLYPVDQSRLDDSVSISENVGAVNDNVDEKKKQ